MEVKTKEDWLYQFRRCSSPGDAGKSDFPHTL